MACPFCPHFFEVDFVYLRVEFFLVALGECVDQSSQILFRSVLVDGFDFCFLEGFVYGLLFTLYPFFVFFEGLFWGFVGFRQYQE